MMTEEEVNKQIAIGTLKAEKISDGYHTFNDLYEHRYALFIALCRLLNTIDFAEWSLQTPKVWKSKHHSDGTSFDGWFVAGIGTDDGKQITYHLPMKFWDILEVDERERAPLFDQHTPNDVIKRLLEL